MGKNILETVGDGATLSYSGTGTLSQGTLTGTTLTGQLRGSVVAVGTASWIALAGVIDITPNNIDVKEVTITELNSVADESQPGTPNWGQIELSIVHDASVSATITAMVTSKTVQFWKVTQDDYSTTDSAGTFLGWVKGFTPIGEADKKDERLMSKLTIRITGGGSLTTGT